MEHEAKVEIVDLTRELAEELAEHIPPYQRNVRSRWVASLASDIDNGRWRIGDSAIVIAMDDKGRGQLQNGQHRVLARLEAKIDNPCPVILLTRTVDDVDDYLAVDAGKKRLFSDYLRLKGEPGITAKSSIVRTILLAQLGGVSGYTNSNRIDISHAEMAQLWNGRDEEIMEDVVKRYYRLVRGIGGMASRYLAALEYIVRTEAPELDIDTFLDAIEHGLDGPTEGPMSAGHLLRQRLLRWAYSDQSPPRTVVARSVLKAWNMWLTGETGVHFHTPKSNKGLSILPDWAKE